MQRLLSFPLAAALCTSDRTHHTLGLSRGQHSTEHPQEIRGEESSGHPMAGQAVQHSPARSQCAT